MANLPITQFYHVSVDNDAPFYNVYGGTQDNFTLGGPSRTVNVHGITQRRLVRHRSAATASSRGRPEDPNIVYAESSTATSSASTGKHRRERRHPAAAGRGRAAAALELGLAADHQPALAHAALLRRAAALPQRRPRRLLEGRSAPTSRGSSTATSCKVMGKVWGADAVAKNASTSFYGNIVALAESPMRRGCSTPAPTTA